LMMCLKNVCVMKSDELSFKEINDLTCHMNYGILFAQNKMKQQEMIDGRHTRAILGDRKWL